MIKEEKKIISYIVVNDIILCILLLWIINHVLWAENIFKFLCWINLIFSLLVSIGYSELKEEIKKEMLPCVSKNTDWAYDLITTFLLIGYGHFKYGIIYFIASVLQKVVYDYKSKEELSSYQ